MKNKTFRYFIFFGLSFFYNGMTYGEPYTLKKHFLISQKSKLKFTKSAIIDGQNLYNIYFSDRATLLIDGAPNTIIRIKNTQLIDLKDDNRYGSSIQFGTAANQQLELENVKLTLGDNFTLKNQITIFGNIIIANNGHTFKTTHQIIKQNGATLTMINSKSK